MVIDGYKLIDGLAQLLGRGEAGPLQGLTSQDAKPTLHLIQPRRIGGGVMKMDSGMAAQPAIGFGLMGIEVVQHHMQVAVRMVRHDLVHEVQELASPTAGIVAGFHLSGGHVQSREQGGRPVACVAVVETGERLAAVSYTHLDVYKRQA